MMTTTRPDVRGSAVATLRPLERGDRASLLEIFTGLSPRSRQLRFLSPKPRLMESELRTLAEVDQQDHVAIVAISPTTGRPIGVGRFVGEAKHRESADVALAVVDAWQGRGIGTQLAHALVARALEVGVRRFTLVMQSDNHAVLRLLRGWTGAVTWLDDDPQTLELAVDLDC